MLAVVNAAVFDQPGSGYFAVRQAIDHYCAIAFGERLACADDKRSHSR
ncbi:MAG: hypothetical protein KME42_12395 [Tildeniella nuda ZEHNDER 1965/U140]|nr:hypothetical protein [Tildeniella nuda ZEHNDER 1965/U140]